MPILRRNILVCILFFLLKTQACAELPSKEIKGDHFIIYYGDLADESLARQVSRKAEEYYRQIDTQIGYSRYTEFWTWDERVKIFIFPDQESFMKETGQPAWSYGAADSDVRFFNSRSIFTYGQADGFLEGVLPHEIGHLVLHDLVADGRKIPIWFDEGVAQLQESNKKLQVDAFMRTVIKKGVYIPLKKLQRWNIRGEKNENKVALFYGQSLSIVDYILKNYGSAAFKRLCADLKDKTFEDALRGAYPDTFGSLIDLEKKWLEYMRH